MFDMQNGSDAMSPKKYTKETYPNDRINFMMGKQLVSVPVGKGWKALLKRIAFERDEDLSKFTRKALDRQIRAIEPELSDAVKLELARLRKSTGGQRVGELPL
jgi:hypothetical protein